MTNISKLTPLKNLAKQTTRLSSSNSCHWQIGKINIAPGPGHVVRVCRLNSRVKIVFRPARVSGHCETWEIFSRQIRNKQKNSPKSRVSRIKVSVACNHRGWGWQYNSHTPKKKQSRIKVDSGLSRRIPIGLGGGSRNVR